MSFLMRLRVALAFALCSALFGTDTNASPSNKPTGKNALSKSVSFVNEVIPVLTRSGCNSGTCHGAAAGKAGFKLSLRGYAPELDYLAITRLSRGRRIDLAQPEKSLFLRKPLLELSHLGGLAVKKGSVEQRILLSWLKQGAPPPNSNDPRVVALRVTPSEQSLSPKSISQLKVEALFSDGNSRDVSHWTRYATNDENVATVTEEGKVSISGVGQTAIMLGYQDRVAVANILVPYPYKLSPADFAKRPNTNYIDDHVFAKLSALHLRASPAASDLEFLRRVTLDLTGELPKSETARAFEKDRDPRKRELLVDALMAKPEFIDFWAYKWSDLLRVNRGMLKDKGMWAYYSYIHDSVRDNKSWDAMAREILTARGNTFLDGPANYFRTALKPEELAENISQGFMGIRVQCAKCHNHPLEKWTQNEYYGMANLFSRVKFKADQGIYINDEMTVYNSKQGDLIQPRLGKPVAAKPLGGPVLALNSPLERRAFFAEWLTRPDNKYFSRSIVNRVWAHFMGRGLVEPVDDLRETNPASNPVLFDALTADFVKHKFDLRYLMRRIVASQTYRLSSAANTENRKDDRFFSHFSARRMTAEELLDALSAVTGVQEEFPGIPPGLRAVQLPDTKVKSDFMDILGRPPRQITCECERSQEPNMAQALLFINGELINRKVTSDGGIAAKLVQSGKSDTLILDELYWTALGRAPKPTERTADLTALKRAMQPATSNPTSLQLADLRRKAFEDMLWVLLNSKEFLFNH